MVPIHRIVLVFLLSGLSVVSTARAQSQLQDALDVMYTACLFGEGSPFSQAVELSQQSLAPGISNFIESTLASIPLSPPVLEAQFQDGEVVTKVTGFTPIYTESSATVGRGQFLVGTSYSYFDLTKMRGLDLNDLSFTFAQDGGGDQIAVNMPFDIDASVFTLFGTLGLSDRLDIGFALPFVQLSMKSLPTTFEVLGSATGCRYDTGCIPGQQDGIAVVDYFFTDGVALDLNADGTIEASDVDNPSIPGTDFYLGTISVRAKYRIPVRASKANLAAVFDVRIPLGADEDHVVGNGYFGWRFTLIGEYYELDTFRPYFNIGAQAWNGVNSNNLNLALGFSQKVARKVFFAFDLLGKLDLEPDAFLSPIDAVVPGGASASEFTLISSAIPFTERDHTLNAGLGLQLALSAGFQLYASSLFPLLDRGLQSDFVPAFGAAIHF